MIGYFGYDAFNYNDFSSDEIFPDIVIGYYDWAIIVNHSLEEAWITFEVKNNLIESIIDKFSNKNLSVNPSSNYSFSDFKQNTSKEKYIKEAENNKFEKEVKNLLIFKKALFISNFANESELLEATKPLLNTETLWKPHTLLLLGGYFASKNEYLKAKEFYIQILNTNNLHQDIYNQARSQLSNISDD